MHLKRQLHTWGKELKQRIGVQTVVKAVADEFGCSEEEILTKGRKRNMARDMAIYLARDLTAKPGVGLGKRFGNITGAGITVRCASLSKKASKSPELQKNSPTKKKDN